MRESWLRDTAATAIEVAVETAQVESGPLRFGIPITKLIPLLEYIHKKT